MEFSFETVDLTATYVRSARAKAAIRDGAELCDVEEFAARHFRRRGFETMRLESTPFRVLFAVYMRNLVEDPCDPRVRTVAFGDRYAFDQRLPNVLIRTRLPTDFGTESYALRRANAITKNLSIIMPDRAELRRLFEDSLGPSIGLRQYIWAHRQESIDAARMLIELIPPLLVKNLLHYLAQNFWGRSSGWPDLLVYQADEWFLAEVKSSRDKLSEKQKRWIADNHRYLHLPFKVVKVQQRREVCPVSGEAFVSLSGGSRHTPNTL
jgi:hypothetical protein